MHKVQQNRTTVYLLRTIVSLIKIYKLNLSDNVIEEVDLFICG